MSIFLHIWGGLRNKYVSNIILYPYDEAEVRPVSSSELVIASSNPEDDPAPTTRTSRYRQLGGNLRRKMSTVIARGTLAAQARVHVLAGTDDTKGGSSSSSASLPDSPRALSGLGVPLQQKRFFWQRSQVHDADAVATLPSVFDDPETAEKYQPRADW